MAMSAGGSSGGVMAEINVTPLVDVMLVLLIIFMITTQLAAPKVKIELPQGTLLAPPTDTPPVPPVTIAVRQDGTIYWNDEQVTEAGLVAQLRVVAPQAIQPEVQIRADKDTEYQLVANVMTQAKNQGMVKVGFITTPERAAQ
jgi:biopolymer transport protein ExbD